MTVPFSVVETEVREALAPYLGQPYSGDLERFFCRDLGLSARNYADFVRALERREGTPLFAWLVDESVLPLRPPMWKRLLGAQEIPPLRDVSVREFCDQVRYLYYRKQSDEEIDRLKYGPRHYH
jgi:hypothetical protein